MASPDRMEVHDNSSDGESSDEENPQQLQDKVRRGAGGHRAGRRREAAEEKEQTKSQEDIPVEESIYKKFTPNEDNSLMNNFHEIEWEKKFAALDRFQDERLKYFGNKLLAIQLQLSGKNSVSNSSIYTDIFIAKPSEPKILPAFKVFDKLFCQELQPFEFFSKEKTPIFI